MVRGGNGLCAVPMGSGWLRPARRRESETGITDLLLAMSFITQQAQRLE